MDQKNRNLLLIGIAAAVLLFCCCIALLVLVWGVSLFPWRTVPRPAVQGPVTVITVPATSEANSMSQPTESAPAAAPLAGATATTAGPAAPALSTPAVRAPGAAVSTTEALLASVDMPQRDMRELALRLKPNTGNIPTVVNTTTPSYKVGDTISFWVQNSDTQEHRQISATLRYLTPHLYMWVEKGADVNDQDLAASAQRFENKTYPTDREFFGSEWSPGVDNDVHLSLLHAHGLGAGIAGAYSSSDEYSHLVNPYSNEKEMFYISLDRGMEPPNTSYYDGVLAHEFQHMIHWYHDRNEESWVNEGFSVLAEHLNGFDVGGFDAAYMQKPDTQLDTWEEGQSDAGINAPHYGGSYLFMDYFLGRFGENLTKAVVADQENGIAGFNDALAKAGRSERFDDIFADWVVANQVNRPDVEPKGRFGYTDINPPAPKISTTHDRLPASSNADVAQYGADYIQVRPPASGPVTVKFDGKTGIGLVDTTPHGQYAWWSNRGDDSDSTLTRPVDLSGLNTATLTFSAWYDVEDGWDYVYVEASTDNGKHWQILPGRRSSTQDKSGNAFGPGWTGNSGGGKTPLWIDERVDLSKYAGQKILLRFEYVTDDAVNGPGFMLDDIAIPELNFHDQGETGTNGWQSSGWILTNNNLTEHWLVQLVTIDSKGVQVQRINVGADGHGELALKDTSGINSMVLIVSAQAPVTTERATYSYNITAR